jgi:hypothetical protein
MRQLRWRIAINNHDDDVDSLKYKMMVTIILIIPNSSEYYTSIKFKMEPLETTGHDIHVKSTKPQNYHLLNSQIDSRDMQDPIEPASTDVDERMSK